MKIERVKTLSPLERFLYWIKERHEIYLKRQRGDPKPWTDDEVLQRWFFTNPYRENDRTTVWFREKVRDPLQNNAKVFFATVCFRWFNLIETGEALLEKKLLTNWDRRKARSALRKQKKTFTGAFMIPAVPGTKKTEHVFNCLVPFWQNRDKLCGEIWRGRSLREAHALLVKFPYMGDFMAYEVVTDLRWTYLLRKAKDIMTWANPGPGCRRGLRRLLGLPLRGKAAAGEPPVPDEQEQMQGLLDIATAKLVVKERMPKLEMREMEHSLCEWDKYERARLKQGSMKRTYQGV